MLLQELEDARYQIQSLKQKLEGTVCQIFLKLWVDAGNIYVHVFQILVTNFEAFLSFTFSGENFEIPCAKWNSRFQFDPVPGQHIPSLTPKYKKIKTADWSNSQFPVAWPRSLPWKVVHFLKNYAVWKEVVHLVSSSFSFLFLGLFLFWSILFLEPKRWQSLSCFCIWLWSDVLAININ